MRLQKMSQSTGLLAELEEDHGLSNLATKNDQRTCASFCHLELIRYELGFLGKLDEEFRVGDDGNDESRGTVHQNSARRADGTERRAKPISRLLV